MREFKTTEQAAREHAKQLKDAAEAEKKARVIDYARKNPGTPIYYYRQRFKVGSVVAKRWLQEAGIEAK